MKLKISLISLIALTAVFCNSVYSQNLQVKCSAANPNEEVTQLIRQINAPNKNGSNFEVMKTAIDRLGVLHAVAAIDDLVRLMPFKKPEVETGLDYLGPIVPPERIFPAWQALIMIGECSFPKMIKIIKENPQNSFLSGGAEYVVIMIKKLNFLDTASFFENAAKKTRNGIQKARLINSAQKFLALEEKMHHLD